MGWLRRVWGGVEWEDMGGGCLKVLRRGPGNAFLYVRPSLNPSVRPQGTGWFATRDPFSFALQELTFADAARGLETGTWAMACHYAGWPGLGMFVERGVASCQRLWRNLSDRHL